MLIATQELPLTKEDRMTLEEEIRYPAPEAEFFELLAATDYKVEYHRGEIISFMSYATDNHETIILNIGTLIQVLLKGKGYRGFGSNRPVFIPNLPGERSYYNPDCFFIRLPQEIVRLAGKMTAESNPALVVEVLSDSTRNFDLGEKKENYQCLPSVKQLLFVEAYFQKAILFTRTDRENEWLETWYFKMTDHIPILGVGSILMEDIYDTCLLPHINGN